MSRDDLHLRVEPEIADATRELALLRGQSINAVITAAIVEHLEAAAPELAARTLANMEMPE